MGFISILEREYKLSLEDVKKSGLEYFAANKADEIQNGLFVMPEKTKQNKLPYIIVTIVVFLLVLFYSINSKSNIQIDESIGKMLPQAIDYIKIKHSILSPLFVDVNANGTFGEARAKVNILKRRVHIDINDTSSLPMLKPWLKKGDKGWFYEKSF